ncbi:MAG: TIGR00701 family protein [Candidatus Liberibacter ctenarytainae]|uniref:Protoporphyrinogen IX oxidase n=1 Tax=Candidatus Liberibacter ctenarytainae TaxID=2020335 RepID=A0A937AC11_9HYPH|nr:TIGR00701 family protein [Candidatus Liberibacter ctenarytainae]
MKILVLDSLGKKIQGIGFIVLFTFLFSFIVFSSQFYLLIKGIHIISVIYWISGLIYLPRILAYHSSAIPGTNQYKDYEIMEKRLLNFIMNPAMILSWMSGLYMMGITLHNPMEWLRIKMIFIFILSVFHVYLAFSAIDFKENKQRHGPIYFKIISQIPIISMIFAVYFSVRKHF